MSLVYIWINPLTNFIYFKNNASFLLHTEHPILRFKLSNKLNLVIVNKILKVLDLFSNLVFSQQRQCLKHYKYVCHVRTV